MDLDLSAGKGLRPNDRIGLIGLDGEPAMTFSKTLLATAFVAIGALFGASAPAMAAEKTVTFAYQDMMTPIRVLMESGELEKKTGYAVKWVKFGGGGDVIRAMASGNVDVGEAGSSPIAAAASQGLPITLFWILDDIANAEQLVARNGSGIKSIADLKGKTVAVPFVSTAHYQLMYALQEAGLSGKDVKLLNMRPPEIAAAWSAATSTPPSSGRRSWPPRRRTAPSSPAPAISPRRARRPSTASSPPRPSWPPTRTS